MELSPELGAALVSLLVAGAGWLKSHSEVKAINEDRETVKANRDADSQQLHDDMIRAQERISTQTSQIKTLFEMAAASTEAVNTLKTQNAKIITLMGTIVKAIDELKAEVKRSRGD